MVTYETFIEKLVNNEPIRSLAVVLLQLVALIATHWNFMLRSFKIHKSFRASATESQEIVSSKGMYYLLLQMHAICRFDYTGLAATTVHRCSVKRLI